MNTNKEIQGCSPDTERTRAMQVLTPRCDVHESEGAIHIAADMPGVAPGAIEVTIDRHVLTLVGHFAGLEHEGYRLVHGERGAGEYRRSFELSNDTDAAGIQAEMKNGVLTVVVPKSKAAHRRIPVLAR